MNLNYQGEVAVDICGVLCILEKDHYGDKRCARHDGHVAARLEMPGQPVSVANILFDLLVDMELIRIKPLMPQHCFLLATINLPHQSNLVNDLFSLESRTGIGHTALFGKPARARSHQTRVFVKTPTLHNRHSRDQVVPAPEALLTPSSWSKFAMTAPSLLALSNIFTRAAPI